MEKLVKFLGNGTALVYEMDACLNISYLLYHYHLRFIIQFTVLQNLNCFTR